MDQRTDRRTDGRTDGPTDRRMDGRTDGRTDQWTDGRTDGRTNKAGCRVAWHATKKASSVTVIAVLHYTQTWLRRPFSVKRRSRLRAAWSLAMSFARAAHYTHSLCRATLALLACSIHRLTHSLRSLPRGTVKILKNVFTLRTRFMGTNAFLIITRNTL